MASSKRCKKRPFSLSLSQSTALESARTRKKINLNGMSSGVSKDEDNIGSLSIVSEEDKDLPKKKLVEEWLERNSAKSEVESSVTSPGGDSAETVLMELEPEPELPPDPVENNPTKVDENVVKESDPGPSTSPVEEEKPEDQPLLQCPLCWKNFDKSQTQASHLKACASANGLTTRQLIDAVDLHKKQLAERKRLGLPMTAVPPAVTKKTAPKKGRPPKDRNLELALALSLSLAQGEQQREDRQEALTSFGFTAKSNGLKKNAPVLLTRTQADRERLITEKVAIVLMDEPGSSQQSMSTPETRPTLQSNQLMEWCREENPLWKKSRSSPSQGDSCTFYVSELSSVIAPTKVEAGTKLRHLSQVPGRFNTPKKQANREPAKKSADESSMSECHTPTNGLSLSALEKEIKAKFLSDWVSMLRSSTMSDVTIYVRGGACIPAHKLVFAARCPNMLLDVIQQQNEMTGLLVDVILWPEISNNAAVCFLEYLYYGSIRSVGTLRRNLTELRWLADSYKADDFVDVLVHFEKKYTPKTLSESSSLQSLDLPANTRKSESIRLIDDNGKKSKCCPPVTVTPLEDVKEEAPALPKETSFLRKSCEEREDSFHEDSIYSQRTALEINLTQSPDPFADDFLPASPPSKPQVDVAALSHSRRKLSMDSPQKCSRSISDTAKEKDSTDSWTKSGSGDASTSTKEKKSGGSSSVGPESDLYSATTEDRESPVVLLREPETDMCTSTEETRASVTSSVKLDSDVHITPTTGERSSVSSPTKPESDNSTTTTSKRRLSGCSGFRTDSDDGHGSNQFELRLSSGSSQGKGSFAERRNSKTTDEACGISPESDYLRPFNLEPNRPKSRQSVNIVDDDDDDDVVIISFSQPGVLTQKDNTARLDQSFAPVVPLVTESPKSAGNSEVARSESPYISPVWSGFEDAQYNIDAPGDWDSGSNREESVNRAESEGEKSVKDDSSREKRFPDVEPDHGNVVYDIESDLDASDHEVERGKRVHSSETGHAGRIHEISSSSGSADENSDLCKKMLDDSMNAIFASSILERAERDGTPQPSPERKRNGSPVSGRVTPMKNYSGMTSPEIETELRKFGMKPTLGKRKGILMLEYIYNELHPWVRIEDKDRIGSETTAVVALSEPVNRNRVTSSQANSCSSSASSSSDDGFSGAESVESDSAVVMSQRALHKLGPADLPNIVSKHITEDPVLHRKILEYEPIFIESLYSDLKTSGYRLKIADLMAYLGEKCINYRSVRVQGGGGRKKREQNGQARKKARQDREEDF